MTMKTHMSRRSIVAWLCLAALSAYAYQCKVEDLVPCREPGSSCAIICGPQCTVLHQGVVGSNPTQKKWTFFGDPGFFLQNPYTVKCNFTCQITRCIDGLPWSVAWPEFDDTGYYVDQDSYCSGN